MTHLADVGIGGALGDDKHRLCLVVHLRTDMPAHVIVALVLMQYAMDVQVIL